MNDDDDRRRMRSQLLLATLCAFDPTGSLNAIYAKHAALGDKTRCAECRKEIPPGRAGRRCKECREKEG